MPFGLFSVKLFSPPFHVVLFGRKSPRVEATLTSWRVKLYPFEEAVSTQIIWSSPQAICLFFFKDDIFFGCGGLHRCIGLSLSYRDSSSLHQAFSQLRGSSSLHWALSQLRWVFIAASGSLSVTVGLHRCIGLSLSYRDSSSLHQAFSQLQGSSSLHQALSQLRASSLLHRALSLLRWVFIAASGFLLVTVSGGCSWLWCVGSHFCGVSCCRPLALDLPASVVAMPGLSTCGAWALEYWFSSCGTWA